ncbi:MAG: hypothetical protein OXN25_01585 [Candidatus Poribacteria bacterium]|nr:hypothetical protein [Candidatus Poribacteria bacterium]
MNRTQDTRGRGGASRPDFTMKELIVLEVDVDEFIVVSGERIETETDPNFYPFGHAVTLRLCSEDAARIGEEIITVSEAEILQDCELPKATELPAEVSDPRDRATPAETQTKTGQLTFFGDTEAQPTLF